MHSVILIQENSPTFYAEVTSIKDLNQKMKSGELNLSNHILSLGLPIAEAFLVSGNRWEGYVSAALCPCGDSLFVQHRCELNEEGVIALHEAHVNNKKRLCNIFTNSVESPQTDCSLSIDASFNEVVENKLAESKENPDSTLYLEFFEFIDAIWRIKAGSISRFTKSE